MVTGFFISVKVKSVGLDQERWFFQDRKVVFVRHGGIFVRVSPNRLQKVTNYLSENETEAEHDYKNSEKKRILTQQLEYLKNSMKTIPKLTKIHQKGQGNAQKTYRLSKEANKNLR